MHHLRQDATSGTKSATSAPPAPRITGPASRSLGVLSVQFDYAAIKKRFRKQQPDWSLFSAVEEKHYPPYPLGHTPFFPVTALGKAFGFENVWLKNDGLNPSASLKDRASFLVVAEANRLKEPSIVTASTGNAASALAAVCAAAGKAGDHLRPRKRPEGQACADGALRRPRHPRARLLRRCVPALPRIHRAQGRPQPQHRLSSADHRREEDGRPGDLPAEQVQGAGCDSRAGRGRRDHQRRLQGVLRSESRRV